MSETRKRSGRPTSSGPSHEEIANLARQIWRVRGKISGYDLDDWLAAERHLRAVGSRKANTPNKASQSGKSAR